MAKTPTHTPKVLLALEMANAAGRQQMIGIFRFLGSTMRWDIRIVQPPTELSDEYIDQCEDEKFDGIITALPCSTTNAERLAKSGIPIVLLDIDYPRLPKSQTCVIKVDDKDIAQQAADYLLKLGPFNDYGYVPYHENPDWSVKREKGFRITLAQNGKTLKIFKGRTPYRPTRDDLVQWLKTLKKPSAIFCANDSCAGRILDACHASDLKVPDQISILGVDDDEYLCGLARPPLSSVRPDFEYEGFLAAQELSRLIFGQKRSKTIKIPTTTITERDSTRQLAPGIVLVNRALEFIKRNAQRNITVTSVITHLGVSRRLADLRFRQLEKKTILEIITHYRLESVKRLLRESNTPIGSISRMCGFQSEGYLKALFRRKCGLSMSEYRTQNATQSEKIKKYE